MLRNLEVETAIDAVKTACDEIEDLFGWWTRRTRFLLPRFELIFKKVSGTAVTSKISEHAYL
jgi:hypothetical protein